MHVIFISKVLLLSDILMIKFKDFPYKIFLSIHDHPTMLKSAQGTSSLNVPPPEISNGAAGWVWTGDLQSPVQRSNHYTTTPQSQAHINKRA